VRLLLTCRFASSGVTDPIPGITGQLTSTPGDMSGSGRADSECDGGNGYEGELHSFNQDVEWARKSQDEGCDLSNCYC
jgi:hypothetical protein